MTIASRPSENPTEQARLMEIILERENMRRALKRVRKNKGAPGVDGMTVEQLPGYLKRHWPKIKQALFDGYYYPFPVRRKDIPKPDGGTRPLGIPTVLDRLIQQAIAQVLQRIWQPSRIQASAFVRAGASMTHCAVSKPTSKTATGTSWIWTLKSSLIRSTTTG